MTFPRLHSLLQGVPVVLGWAAGTLLLLIAGGAAIRGGVWWMVPLLFVAAWALGTLSIARLITQRSTSRSALSPFRRSAVVPTNPPRGRRRPLLPRGFEPRRRRT